MLHTLSDLLIITPQVVLVLVVVTLAAGVGTVHFARAVRRLPALICGLLVLLLVPATAADAVNAHYQFLPRVADVLNRPTWPTVPADVVVHPTAVPARHPTGAVVRLELPGPVSGFGTHTAYVYLPPQYFTEPARRFPVLYLLHGSPGAPIDWFRAARAASAGLSVARAGYPTILVAPRASRWWTDDSECVDRPVEHIETYLTVDVPTSVDRLLRTVRMRTARGLVGNSAGGYCALDLGLRHRDVFGGVADLSGYDHPTFDGGMAGLFGTRHHLADLVRSHTPSDYVHALTATPKVWVWLDCGRADKVPCQEALQMRTALTGAHQVAVVRQRNGGHDYGVWRPALQAGSLWLAEVLGAARGAVPTPSSSSAGHAHLLVHIPARISQT